MAAHDESTRSRRSRCWPTPARGRSRPPPPDAHLARIRRRSPRPDCSPGRYRLTRRVARPAVAVRPFLADPPRPHPTRQRARYRLGTRSSIRRCTTRRTRSKRCSWATVTSATSPASRTQVRIARSLRSPSADRPRILPCSSAALRVVPRVACDRRRPGPSAPASRQPSSGTRQAPRGAPGQPPRPPHGPSSDCRIHSTHQGVLDPAAETPLMCSPCRRSEGTPPPPTRATS